MGRTPIMRQYGYDNDFLRCQDYDMFVRMSARHRLGNLPEILVEGRQHAGQITLNPAEIGEGLKRRIAGRQLAELGLPFSDSDLAAHVGLSQTPKTRSTPARAPLARTSAKRHRG